MCMAKYSIYAAPSHLRYGTISGSTSASATFSMPHNSIFMKNIAMLAVMNFRAPLRPQCAPRYMHIMLLGPGVMQVITIYSISGA